CLLSSYVSLCIFFFFFQAEDGIRDRNVTGVQTCALPIFNMLALGIGLFLTKEIYGKGQTEIVSEQFFSMNIPVLSKIPIIGPLFFQGMYLTTYLAIIFAFIAWWVIYKTPFGLHLLSVGDYPMAEDTNGINVLMMRYIAVTFSGALGGLGGSVYALSIALNFSHSTISGQGFMALAAVIFGKWHPLGAM